MAIIPVENPTSGTPSLPGDYTQQNETVERDRRGGNHLSLTNWDATTTAPQVAAGSSIEINGKWWDVTTNTGIATTDASSGTNYLVFDDDAVAFGWNDTAPTWSVALNGWYVSGDRFTGHRCYWDGAASFQEKYRYTDGDTRALVSNSGAVFNTGYSADDLYNNSVYSVSSGSFSLGVAKNVAAFIFDSEGGFRTRVDINFNASELGAYDFDLYDTVVGAVVWTFSRTGPTDVVVATDGDIIPGRVYYFRITKNSGAVAYSVGTDIDFASSSPFSYIVETL